MSGKEYVAACSESMKLASSPKPVHKVNINVDIDVDHIVVPFLSGFRKKSISMSISMSTILWFLFSRFFEISPEQWLVC